jgi:hypothetical protein
MKDYIYSGELLFFLLEQSLPLYHSKYISQFSNLLWFNLCLLNCFLFFCSKEVSDCKYAKFSSRILKLKLKGRVFCFDYLAQSSCKFEILWQPVPPCELKTKKKDLMARENYKVVKREQVDVKNEDGDKTAKLLLWFPEFLLFWPQTFLCIYLLFYFLWSIYKIHGYSNK